MKTQKVGRSENISFKHIAMYKVLENLIVLHLIINNGNVHTYIQPYTYLYITYTHVHIHTHTHIKPEHFKSKCQIG